MKTDWFLHPQSFSPHKYGIKNMSNFYFNFHLQKHQQEIAVVFMRIWLSYDFCKV